jgi:O-antigen/teichoic acid export membrane protein
MKIKATALLSYINLLMSVLYGFIFIPLLVNLLGNNLYGIYGLILAIISFFTIDFGFGEAISKFVAHYDVLKNQTLSKNFTSLIIIIFGFISVIIMILLIIFFSFLSKIFVGLTDSEIMILKDLSILIISFITLMIFLSPINGILIGRNKVFFVRFSDTIQRFLLVLFTLLALLFNPSIYIFVTVYVSVAIISKLIRFLYALKKGYLNLGSFKFKSSDIRELFNFSAWNFLFSFSNRFLFYVTPIIIGYYFSSNFITFFSLALSIEGYFWTVFSALNGVYLHELTRLKSINDMSRINQLMIQVGRFQYFVLNLLIFAFILFGNSFFFLWLGEGYQLASHIAIFIVLHGVVYYTQGVGHTLILINNKIRLIALSSLISTSISVILMLLLLPTFGIVFSGLAIFLGNTITHIFVTNYIFEKHLGINVKTFFKSVHLKLLVPSLLSIIFGILFQNFFNSFTYVNFFIQGALFSLMFITLNFFIGLNQDDRKNVYKYFIKINEK